MAGTDIAKNVYDMIVASREKDTTRILADMPSILPYMKWVDGEKGAIRRSEAVDKATTVLEDIIGYVETNAAVVPSWILKLMTGLDDMLKNAGDMKCKRPLDDVGVTFDQIGGQELEKNQLRVNYIYPFQFRRLFPDIAKGTLLYGPPGTGKTLLAKAATHELKDVGVAFFVTTPGELKGRYVGDSERNIQMVFDCARDRLESNGEKYKFAIVFFDEFEAIAGQRVGTNADPHMTATVTALLQAMDGIASDPRITVLAATNHPNNLDSAVRRRFTTTVFIDLPDFEARKFIITQRIVRAFAPPKYSAEDRKKIVGSDKKNLPIVDETFDLLVEHGALYATDKRTLKSEFRDRKAVEAFVETISKRTGPSPDAKPDMKHRTGAKEFDTSSVGMYGYSGSDIDKMMSLAITDASMRVLSMGTQATYKRIQMPTHVAQATSPVSELYYVFDGRHEGVRIEEHLTNVRSQLLNFCITEDDVKRAMQAYPSTIDTNDISKGEYKSLANWKSSA